MAMVTNQNNVLVLQIDENGRRAWLFYKGERLPGQLSAVLNSNVEHRATVTVEFAMFQLGTF